MCGSRGHTGGPVLTHPPRTHTNKGFLSNTGPDPLKITKLLSQHSIIVSEYDQEIPQSQTADNTVAPRGRAAQPSRDTRKTN